MASPEKLDKLICELSEDQRRRWIAQQPVLAESYLSDHAEVFSCDESRLEFIYKEFCLRSELGDTPSAIEYVRRFPNLAAKLMRRLKEHPTLVGDSRQQRTAVDPLAHTVDPVA